MKRIQCRYPFFLTLVVALISSCTTETSDDRPRTVRIGNPDGNYIVPGSLGQIVYRDLDGIELSLDAYIQTTEEVRPGVVVVHGGRWSSGSRVTFVGQFLEMLTEAGFNWFSIDFRHAPEYSVGDSVDDLRAALEFIRSHAEFFRVDPKRLAVLGEETGGHLATLLAEDRPDLVAALVTFGAPFDLNSLEGEIKQAAVRAVVRGARENSESALAAASPYSRLSEGGFPPILAVHGSDDEEVPLRQARRFCEHVRALDETCRLLEVPGGSHRAENWLPSQWSYKAEVVQWLQQQLRTGRLEEKPHQDPKLRKNLVFASYQRPGGEPIEVKLDAWIPDGEGPFPAVIVAHGGGWEAGDKVTYVTPLFEPLAEAGFAWFSIDYRLTPGYRNPDQLDDLRRAVRFVRFHHGKFKVDPDRLAIVGESASGQMVVQVASGPCPGESDSSDPVDQAPCGVQAVVSFYGVYDFPSMVKDVSPRSIAVRLFGLNNLGEEAKEVLRDYSPLYRVHSGMPPLLLINGTGEFLFEQAVQLEKRLKEVGAHHKLIALPDAPHGMENWEGRPEWTVYKTQMVDWLRLQLEKD